jgi:hypothetical protein
MSCIPSALDLVPRDSDVLKDSVVDHFPSRFDVVGLPLAEYFRPQPGKDRSEQGPPCGSVNKIGVLMLGMQGSGAIFCLTPIAGVHGPTRLRVPDALFDRC